MNIVVLERNSVGTDVAVEFDALGDVTYYQNTVTLEETADIVVIKKAKMNEATLKNAPNVKLICLFATGYDNCDLVYCKKRGIKVANVMDYSTAMVAQHTFTLALALLQKLPFYDAYVKSDAYSNQERFSYFDIPIYELEGKTWGIVGMGNIGKRVAKIAEAFGCRVIFHSVTGTSKVTQYEQVDKNTLLEQSDILSLHCPLSDLTRNFIDKEAIKKMKKSAVLVNVARGAVVNNTDLYEALVNEEIMAAGLDVIEQEPLALTNPLSKMKDSNKLIITPHIGWASVEARTRCVYQVYKNIEAFQNGVERNIVNIL